MSGLIPGNGKHLSLEDRNYIEESLNAQKSFREIARYLCKDPTTISKEVWRHRIVNTWNHGSFNNPYNFCIHRFHCKKMNACKKLTICDKLCRSCHSCNYVCSHFERESCRQIEKAPFVCNGCGKPRHACPIQDKYNYDAKAAQRNYEELLVASREGISMTKAECHKLDRIVKPLVEQGQSPYMIIANHPELGISVKSLYNYIDTGALMARNVDLKRKVKFKPRQCHKSQIRDREIFNGRTYRDFKEKRIDDLDFAEMDTVKSAKGSGKCILTFYLPATELFLAYLMLRCTPGAVRARVELMEKALGGYLDFAILFPAILTDRGFEFGDPERLEHDGKGRARTSIFYCDPMRSNQKAGIENVHTMLRMILPKGTVFSDLTQWDVRKCVDHINNAPRKKLGGRTPYEMAVKAYDEDTMKKLQLRYIAPDEVTLSPKLLKN
jgi:IS30 family transposase